MKVVGLVTEYNPFHNGHLHHLQQSLRTTTADASVAVMSGHFLQRGEPALVDKWLRSEMALAAGVDLLFELPFPFACNSAPHFARGAVQSLHGLGLVDALCFGSEAGSLDLLQKAAGLLSRHAGRIEECTAQLLRQGVNYPTARTRVLEEIAPGLPPESFAQPNNILGLEYLRALAEADSGIQPATIARLGPGYHDTTAADRIASATGLRQMLAEGKPIATFLPEGSRMILREALREGQNFDQAKLLPALLVLLLREPETLRGLYQVEHGLENRLAEAALQAGSFTELAVAAKSRQWTLTRIQRILIYVLLQANQEEMNALVAAGPLYLRLLGMSDTGRKCLAQARTRRTLPIIRDPAKGPALLRRWYGTNSERARLAEAMLKLDLRATRVYAALIKSPGNRHRNRDFFEPVRTSRACSPEA